MKDYTDVLNSSRNNKMNFLNGNAYSDEYYTLADKWSELPVYKNKETTKEFFNLLESKQVILITSGTGSGKTVIIPKFILKYAIDNNYKGMVAVTNPKILTTKSNAVYAAQTLDVGLGEEVGYKYKNSDSKHCTDKTRLLYLTDGTLLSIITNLDKTLSNYYAVVIDEAHERQIQIDLLLMFIKKILIVRPDMKLIIMSATINASVFESYFNTNDIKYGALDVHKTANYTIDRIWATENINQYNYLKESIKIINGIIKAFKDLLIFVPTQKDTVEGCNLITKTNKKIYCSEVYSKMTDENKELAISKDKYKTNNNYKMKIIFATNVAESSITVDGLKYVIDTGLELINTFDSKYNMNVIKKDYTTQAQILQRIGRVGRTSPGVAYHLYTREKFESLDKYPRPSILTSNIIMYLLSMIKYFNSIDKAINTCNTMITPPTNDQINNSLHILNYTKCINSKRMTLLGELILKFRTDNIFLILSVLNGHYLKCQKEMIIIMAMIETLDGKTNQLFTDTDDKIMNKFKKLSVSNSDHLTLLELYNLYKNNKIQYLNISTFQKIEEQIKKYTHVVKSIKKKLYEKLDLISIEPYEDLNKNILYSLYKSHLHNLLDSGLTTKNFMNNSKGKVEFFKFTKEKKIESKPKYIFHVLTNMFSKKIFQCTSVIDFL